MVNDIISASYQKHNHVHWRWHLWSQSKGERTSVLCWQLPGQILAVTCVRYSHTFTPSAVLDLFSAECSHSSATDSTIMSDRHYNEGIPNEGVNECFIKALKYCTADSKWKDRCCGHAKKRRCHFSQTLSLWTYRLATLIWLPFIVNVVSMAIWFITFWFLSV